MPHNGGLTQVNFPGIQTGGDYAFLNLWKTMQGWTRIDNVVGRDPEKHDANGYMHTVYGGGVYSRLFIASQTARPGNYVLIWDGGGTMHWPAGVVAPGNSKTSSALSVDNRCEFTTPASTTVDMGVSAVSSAGTDYPKFIAFCHVDDEAACMAGRAYEKLGLVPPGHLFFGVKFLARLRESGVGALRFMNTSVNNGSSIGKWAERTPVSHFSYAAHHVPLALYAGTTSNSGDDYTIAFSGFTLTDKAKVIVKWNASSGASPRLNVEGTGLKYVKDKYVNQNGSNVIPYTVRYPLLNMVCCLTYDADLDCYLMEGGSTEGWHGGSYIGWPFEVMFELCNEIGAHCSIPMPRYALDPMTDFVPELCAAWIAVADPGLKLKGEGPNETWNTAGGFANTYFAKEKEKLRNGGTDNDYHEWYGRAISKIGQAFSTAFNADRTKYDVICGVWTFGGTPSSQDKRLTSPRYVTETGDANLAAKFWVTRVDVTGYWTPSQYGSATETTAANDYAAASGAAAKAAVVNTFMLDDSGTHQSKLSSVYVKYAAWKAWIDGFGLGIKFGQYEGGYSPDYGADSTINTFRAATKNWPNLYRKTYANYETFVNTYGGEEPSCYRLSGRSETPAAWSVLEDVWVTPDPPQWTAIKHFNSGIKRFLLTTS